MRQLGRQPRMMMNVMNVRVTNKRLADVPTNTVPRLRRLRIDRHGRPRLCGEALEREVEDGHSYRVTCARLLKRDVRTSLLLR